MRVRELEAWLASQGWQRERDNGGSTVAWHHTEYPGQRLTYHRPHGTAARELRPDVVRAIHKRLVLLTTTRAHALS